MKKTALLLILLLPCAVFAAGDCAKNSDACSSGSKKLSPFLAASAADPKTGAPAPGPLKQASLRQSTRRQAALVPEQVEISTPAAEPEAAPAQDTASSSPLWLVFVALGVAGLYFYLRGNARKRGRKK